MKMKLFAVALGAMLVSPLVLADATAHWSYGGKTGPTHWAELDQHFTTCKLGHSQSPINIVTKRVEKADLKPIAFNYTPGSAEEVNNGHTIQINLPAGGAVNIDGVDYKLAQFHFHTPSEEKINGKAFPLVAHMVHKSDDGKLAVVAVLFKLGKENAALKPLFAHLPAKEGDKQNLEAEFNPADLLPDDHAYYAFMGSLTTPPCSEEVRWQVLKTPVQISKAQLKEFKRRYTMNARPVQPLNGREVRVGG